jgi:hypothetical protein
MTTGTWICSGHFASLRLSARQAVLPADMISNIFSHQSTHLGSAATGRCRGASTPRCSAQVQPGHQIRMQCGCNSSCWCCCMPAYSRPSQTAAMMQQLAALQQTGPTVHTCSCNTLGLVLSVKWATHSGTQDPLALTALHIYWPAPTNNNALTGHHRRVCQA